MEQDAELASFDEGGAWERGVHTWSLLGPRSRCRLLQLYMMERGSGTWKRSL